MGIEKKMADIDKEAIGGGRKKGSEVRCSANEGQRLRVPVENDKMFKNLNNKYAAPAETLGNPSISPTRTRYGNFPSSTSSHGDDLSANQCNNRETLLIPQLF